MSQMNKPRKIYRGDEPRRLWRGNQSFRHKSDWGVYVPLSGSPNDVDPVAQAFATYPTVENLKAVQSYLWKIKQQEGVSLDPDFVNGTPSHVWRDIEGWDRYLTKNDPKRRGVLQHFLARHAPRMKERMLGDEFRIISTPAHGDDERVRAENMAAMLDWATKYQQEARKRKLEQVDQGPSLRPRAT